MSQDKDKNKIDLEKIVKLTANKPKRTALMIVFSGLSGLLTGHSTVGLIIMLLALGGVAVSFILNILPAIIASFVFAGFSVVLAYREIKYVQESLRQNKEALDENVNKLTFTLNRVLLWHRNIAKKINEINAELVELEKMPAEKRQRLEFTIRSLKANVNNLKNKQNEVLSYLAATLSLMTDNSSDTLLNRLNFSNLHDLIGTAHLKSDNIRLTQPEIDIPKAPNKAFGSFLGKTNILLGGIYSGITLVTGGVTVVCLCLGIAAFSLVGWPALVGVIAVGLLVTAGTIAYGKAKKRQEKALKEVISVNQKLMSINNELNREIESVKHNMKVPEEHYTSFVQLSLKANKNHIAMQNQGKPAELFHLVDDNIEALNALELLPSVEETIEELNDLKWKVINQNGTDIGLLKKIDNSLEMAIKDRESLSIMRKQHVTIEVYENQFNKQKQKIDNNHPVVVEAELFPLKKHFGPSASHPTIVANEQFDESIKQTLVNYEKEAKLKDLGESIKKSIHVLEDLKVQIVALEVSWESEKQKKLKLLEGIEATLKLATEDNKFLKDRKHAVSNMEPTPEAENDCELKKDDGNPSAVNSEHP
jgi:hypothetical protein